MVGEMANDVRRAGPAAPADENRLADIAAAWTDYLPTVNSRGCTLFSLGALSCREYGRCARAAILPMARCRCLGRSKLAQADKHTNAGMLRERFIITARRW